MSDSKKTNIALWIGQGFLALFFALASGAPKLLLPQEMLGMWLPLPDAFVKFIGVAEVLGALGLILPGLTRIRPGLTPLAASGLVIVTLSATVYQLAGGRVGNALFALGLGGVVAIVAYGRWRQSSVTRDGAEDLLQLSEREHQQKQEEAQPAGDDHAHLVVQAGASSVEPALATPQ
jgi:hypothetical protein